MAIELQRRLLATGRIEAIADPDRKDQERNSHSQPVLQMRQHMREARKARERPFNRDAIPLRNMIVRYPTQAK
jgi:hypothetical protein